MKDAQQFLETMHRFLLRKETEADKRMLLSWYENFGRQAQSAENKSQQAPEQAVYTTGQQVKQRVFESIRQEATANSILRKLHTRVYAAASILLLLGLGYWFYARQPEAALKPSQEMLAQVLPQDAQAKITLEDGKVIDLEKMSLNSSIRDGDMEIIKDADGQISYKQHPSAQPERGLNTMQTPASANYSLCLSDGTVVMLNAATKLTYPKTFQGGDRVVELEGEAYFKVSKTSDKQRFIVKTKRQQTEVLGTSFNIKAHPLQAEERISLEEGLVRVHSTKLVQPMHLKPGQQALFEGATVQLKTVDLDGILAWTQGFFYLDGQNTEAVLQEIAAWYDIDINYQKPAQAKAYKGKIPKNLPLDKLIQLLEFTELKTKPILENQRIKLLIK